MVSAPTSRSLFSLCSMLLLLFLGTPALRAQAFDLTIELETIRSARGKLMMSLFNSADGFPSTHQKAMQIRQVPAQKGKMVVVFDGVPPGTYAVAVFHDENGDGKLNSNAFGAPKEPWGASNNVRPMFSAPSFKEASFRHQQAGRITIQVK